MENIFPLHKTENIHCTKEKIYAAQKQKIYTAPNRKYTLHKKICSLHKRKNIRCTKRKIYAAQNRKYTLHKRENIRCTKEKIYAAQKRKYTLHKTENIRCTKVSVGWVWIVMPLMRFCFGTNNQFCLMLSLGGILGSLSLFPIWSNYPIGLKKKNPKKASGQTRQKDSDKRIIFYNLYQISKSIIFGICHERWKTIRGTC